VDNGYDYAQSWGEIDIRSRQTISVGPGNKVGKKTVIAWQLDCITKLVIMYIPWNIGERKK
jgi:hypothetical protein